MTTHAQSAARVRTGEVINALVLDDQEFDRTRIRRFAQKSNLPINIVEVPSIEEMRQRMSEEAFDLFLVDYQLPDGDGLRAVDLIHEDEASRDAAVIMITGQEKVDIAVNAFRHGCHDLITKDELSPILLHDRLQHALQRVSLTAAPDLFAEERFQRHLQHALHQEMRSDAMREMVHEGLARAVRAAQPIAALEESEKMEGFLLDFLRRDEFDFS